MGVRTHPQTATARIKALVVVCMPKAKGKISENVIIVPNTVVKG